MERTRSAISHGAIIVLGRPAKAGKAVGHRQQCMEGQTCKPQIHSNFLPFTLFPQTTNYLSCASPDLDLPGPLTCLINIIDCKPSQPCRFTLRIREMGMGELMERRNRTIISLPSHVRTPPSQNGPFSLNGLCAVLPYRDDWARLLNPTFCPSSQAYLKP